MSESYYQQISQWCEEHGIALAGHPGESDDIGLLKYFYIPGQDLVWRYVAPEDEKALVGRESTMGKCSSDAARHSGKRRNSNECFGCCGPNDIQWAFTVDNMKWYLDWMFVCGVNLLYPHAFFYSIDGEVRSGERPPDVGPNNTFWKYYKNIATYIKRMCWLMTDSYNVTSTAVLCEEVYLPWESVKELYCNQIEFNYLEKEVLTRNNCREEAFYGMVQLACSDYKDGSGECWDAWDGTQKEVSWHVGENSICTSLVLGRRESKILCINNPTVIDTSNQFDISGILREGVNTIKINVSNTPANKLENTKLASGILGAVRLLVF